MEHAAGRAPAGAVGHGPARHPDQERAGVIGVLAQPVPSVRAGLRRRRSGAAGADSRRWTDTGWRRGTPRLYTLEPATGTPPCPDIRTRCDQGILSPVRIDWAPVRKLAGPRKPTPRQPLCLGFPTDCLCEAWERSRAAG